jgi:glutamine synthetase
VVDSQGRLQGKRFDAEYFVSEVVPHGAESCTYLLAVDIDMNPVAGRIRPPQTAFRPHFAMRPSCGAIARSPERRSGTMS